MPLQMFRISLTDGHGHLQQNKLSKILQNALLKHSRVFGSLGKHRKLEGTGLNVEFLASAAICLEILGEGMPWTQLYFEWAQRFTWIELWMLFQVLSVLCDVKR